MQVDLAPVDALILSHGHYDHTGGLMGFLRASRSRMRPGLRLYTAGEGNFCWRYTRNRDGSFTPFGTPLDRRQLRALEVEAVLSEAPLVIAGQAFTTGAIPRTSFEHVLPNTWVEYGLKDGLGCNPAAYHDHAFTASELGGQPVPDQHWHEQASGTATSSWSRPPGGRAVAGLRSPATDARTCSWRLQVAATCFHLRGRGLIVITSCGHAGIINTLLRAREVSGIDKIHALVGGFHLGPAPDDYLRQEMAALETFEPDFILPMHCSGQNFIDLAKQRMPGQLILCCTGSSYHFTA